MIGRHLVPWDSIIFKAARDRTVYLRSRFFNIQSRDQVTVYILFEVWYLQTVFVVFGVRYLQADSVRSQAVDAVAGVIVANRHR